jgi:hypothetical protein
MSGLVRRRSVGRHCHGDTTTTVASPSRELARVASRRRALSVRVRPSFNMPNPPGNFAAVSNTRARDRG